MQTKTYTVLALNNAMLYPITADFTSAKPFTPKRIERALREYLRRHRSTLADFQCVGITEGASAPFLYLSGWPFIVEDPINLP